MPPVRLMGHLLPSRLPDKRGHHTLQQAQYQSRRRLDVSRSTLSERLRAKNTDIVEEGSWDRFVQAPERYPLWLVPGRLAYRT